MEIAKAQEASLLIVHQRESLLHWKLASDLLLNCPEHLDVFLLLVKFALDLAIGLENVVRDALVDNWDAEGFILIIFCRLLLFLLLMIKLTLIVSVGSPESRQKLLPGQIALLILTEAHGEHVELLV